MQVKECKLLYLEEKTSKTRTPFLRRIVLYPTLWYQNTKQKTNAQAKVHCGVNRQRNYRLGKKGTLYLEKKARKVERKKEESEGAMDNDSKSFA